MAAERRARVLVVDDDDDLRTLIGAILESEGYEVDVAGDGVEGLVAVDRARPDLVVLDLKMPRMDGATFARELRRRPDPPSKIVVLTAADDPQRRAAEIGADSWLGKPFDLDALVATVRRLLGARGSSGWT